jgi:hypothetical protein
LRRSLCTYGAKRTANIRAFAPLKAEPFQIFDDGIEKFRPASRDIEIFDPQNQISPRRSRPLLRAPKRHGVSDV